MVRWTPQLVCPGLHGIGFPLPVTDLAVGQHQWYHFGVGAPPILLYFSGDWDVYWGDVVLTHGHLVWDLSPSLNHPMPFVPHSHRSGGLD